MSDFNGDVSSLQDMPDIILVTIAKKLSLGERYNFSLTCQTFNKIFNHPSLWATVVVDIASGRIKNWDERHETIVIPKKYYEIFKKFVRCIQDLTVNMYGDVRPVPDDWAFLLCDLEVKGVYNLRKLTLNLGDIVSADKFRSAYYMPNTGTVYLLLTFLRNVYKLKSLIIKAWPLHAVINHCNNFLDVIQENKSLKHTLETLSLYWPKKSDWVTKNANLPTIVQMKSVLNHLCALQELSLRSCMLNDEVIEALAQEDHVKLKKLEVLIIHSLPSELLPDISSTSWLALLKHSPRLQVECSIMTRVPVQELSRFLKPEVPLIAITFLKYSHCDSEILFSITDKYRRTLSKLIDFSNGDKWDDALLNLVNHCHLLNYLVYHRNIHFTTIPRLANIRGTKWQQFEFKESSIDTKDEEEDSDLVIWEREPGVYYQYNIERFHEEAEKRDARLETLQSFVRGAVGYNWAPV